MDRFKQVNDTLGHQAGDLLLKHVAEVFRKELTENAFISRIGGDEFILLLPLTEHSKKDLQALAQNLIEKINVPIMLKGKLTQIGCSIGISIFPDNEFNDFHTLISYADQALYASKEAGKNRVTFYSKFD
ncbi:diguanylate cyclase domain-containing protein [Jeotgalibacillus proteolyticus]|uniref:diguanylate cyclase domain-containing protein n=1 Tax=Jeotgalibacillus proteolyticus TaxID=2082395 RepID=UPI001FD71539|nr:GGDEF domain-containing protein [Jeotgalibacillus proteolyticus]